MPTRVVSRPDSITTGAVIGTQVDVCSYESASAQIAAWAVEGIARTVCVANVHMLMEAHDDPAFAEIMHEADMVTPDGMPLVWALRKLGRPEASRVYGPTLTLHVCREAEERGIPVGLYGGTPDSLDAFKAFLAKNFPALKVACAIAPPFRPLTDEEDEVYTNEIVDSGARIVFVGIGCPKQEKWMHAHRKSIPAVMIGVGAAFDFHSGRVLQAPDFLQKIGMEWAFRLAMEPRRLWKRYFKHNPRFVFLLCRQLISSRGSRH
jgi:N-acetylglucosaminyldiphosphoundecaprenol N-acetyl-beta-D-mannosaminyltransferase